jgi:hypothetical protein
LVRSFEWRSKTKLSLNWPGRERQTAFLHLGRFSPSSAALTAESLQSAERELAAAEPVD